MFQSHNGAIAATPLTTELLLLLAFQSHNGAIAALHEPLQPPSPFAVSIPQWCDCCLKDSTINLAIECFNPTMVRLLPLDPAKVVALEQGFNPTMVRLLPKAKFWVLGAE